MKMYLKIRCRCMMANRYSLSAAIAVAVAVVINCSLVPILMSGDMDWRMCLLLICYDLISFLYYAFVMYMTGYGHYTYEMYREVRACLLHNDKQQLKRLRRSYKDVYCFMIGYQMAVKDWEAQRARD